MASPEVYISRPGVHFPATAVDNAEVLRGVRASFRGTEDQFAVVAAAIDRVFRLCKTKVRYIEPDVQPGMVADYAVTAARRCIEANDASLGDIDLLISGGIARQ